jgi:hypothetical protein
MDKKGICTGRRATAGIRSANIGWAVERFSSFLLMARKLFFMPSCEEKALTQKPL